MGIGAMNPRRLVCDNRPLCRHSAASPASCCRRYEIVLLRHVLYARRDGIYGGEMNRSAHSLIAQLAIPGRALSKGLSVVESLFSA
jgi:hypothetical protein